MVRITYLLSINTQPPSVQAFANFVLVGAALKRGREREGSGIVFLFAGESSLSLIFNHVYMHMRMFLYIFVGLLSSLCTVLNNIRVKHVFLVNLIYFLNIGYPNCV